MKQLSGPAIRRLFLDYFARKGHEIVPTSPLVPRDDPSLLFTNAGMVQFKQVFLGEEKRSYVRAASSQKCVRAGGKHNDLENVGYTARHHTFFEMLGNFSFGDYFKADAIFFAWEFLTRELELPVEKLWVTIFRDDDEAGRLWTEITGISPERVVRLGEKDNFWAMGDTGPCGPCSEILIDQGPETETACGRPDCRVGCDCDRFLELWNLVFMEFFRDEAGTLKPLPKKNIDTGMGLERIAAICQGKTSNFDTDLFAGLFARIERLSGETYGRDHRSDVAMRVIADHARASAFLIADGVLPSNEGRGYVLRRIIRRAVRYGRIIGLREPFLQAVAQAVVDGMGDVYPELVQSSAFLGRVIEHEESRFAETLEYGLRILDEELASIRGRHAVIPGAFIFKLYDTYGFPVDILQDVAKEEGLDLDRDGFEQAMSEQRARSRMAHRETAAEELPQVYRDILNSGEGGAFVGYDTLSHDSRVLALVCNGAAVPEAGAGWSGELVVAETPFYAESGGQVGDKGWVEGAFGRARVRDTRKRGDLIVHDVEVTEGGLAIGETVRLMVLDGPRIDTARNHTATHLLHASLRSVLGEHVKQAGSLVSPERLRFDFSHFAAITAGELRRIEDMVNEQVRADNEVCTESVSHDEAIGRGAVALFGEKYGETVRLVSVPDFSMELCGGTHIPSTGRIGLFKIVSESSVASGVRRIEALTAQAALDCVHEMEDELVGLAAGMKCPRSEVAGRAAKLQQRVKQLEKELAGAHSARGSRNLEELIAGARDVNGVRVVAATVDAGDAKTLRDLGDRLRDMVGSGVVVLGAEGEGKALLLSLVTKDLTKRLHAGRLIGSLAKVVGGGGGGRPDMAQAGGPLVEKLPEAVETAYDVVRSFVGGKSS
jgi:alanyl-tRNA synthetase